ncbi:hypothetical protein [Dactylosporangium darangshiense]|uniref:hypothetical protein n=1 Tax=Dactylosporangium darangshiense TaxID=579108 RepID=UPI003629512D
MRKRLASIAVAGLIAGSTVVIAQAPAAAAPTSPHGDLAAGIKRQLAAGIQVVPKQTAAGKLAATGAANPYTALLRDPSKVDKYYWSEQAKAAGQARSQQKAPLRNSLAAATPPLVHDEAEPKGTHGSNDSHATAELIKGFGTGRSSTTASASSASSRRRSPRPRRRARRPRTTARSPSHTSSAWAACATPTPPPARSATARTAAPATPAATSTSPRSTPRPGSS